MISEVSSKDINLSSFKVKKELNPKFWHDGKLNSRVRLRLMDIADDFVKGLSVDWVKPDDMILTGSMANYNWSRYSDIDIHILIDFKKVYPKSSEFVADYFKAKKENWLSEHEDLRIFGFPIEISVEDSNEKSSSPGRYSLYKNKWLSAPGDFQDTVINQEFVKRKAAEIMTRVDDIEENLYKETDKSKCEKYGDNAHRIFDKLKDMRHGGLASDKGEMSSGNIIYKIMRRTGYLDKIWEIVNCSYDKANSIDERKIINEAQERGERFSAGIIPFRMNGNGRTEVFLGFPGQPESSDFNPPAWMDRWQILKGHMEKGEDPMECAVREFCEESGARPKSLGRNRLISIGKERMGDGRSLVCYAIDLTDDDEFDKTRFHSNMIDSKEYIKLNGGKPYPEMARYAWKEIGEIRHPEPHELAFYEKCDDICQSRYEKPRTHRKTIVISGSQRESIKEAMDSSFNKDVLHGEFSKDREETKEMHDLLGMPGKYMNACNYCTEHFGKPIYEDLSRKVFQIDDTRVLKLAANKSGQTKNRNEWNYFREFPDKGMIAIVYDDSDTENFMFLVSEFVIPAEEEDFKNVVGIPFRFIDEFCYCMAYTNKSEKENFYGAVKDNETAVNFLDTLCRLVSSGVDPNDLGEIWRWGLVRRNGGAKLVVADCHFAA